MHEIYEITFIVGEDDKADAVRNILAEAGAKIVKETDLGSKQFAYTIKKKSVGHYFAIEFEIARDSLNELEKHLKSEKSLVRYLIVKALRKPVDLPKREKPAKEEAKKEEGVAAEPEAAPIEQDAELSASAPEAESEPEVKPEPEIKEEAPQIQVEANKEEKPAKPARKPKAKAEKVSAEELDKKLEELVKE